MTLLSDVLAAYLSPLLKKHSNMQVIEWEDLQSSYKEAQTVLKASGSDNIFVEKKLQNLHNSQVQAYEEAARTALAKWVEDSAPTEAMKEDDTEAVFLKRNVNSILTNRSLQIPNWNNAIKLLPAIIEARARKLYQKYHPSNDTKTPDAGAGTDAPKEATAEDTAMDDGELATIEEGEEDGEEGEEGEEAEDKANDEAEAKKKLLLMKKKAALSSKKSKEKMTTRKKGTASKAKLAGKAGKTGAATRLKKGRGGASAAKK